MSIIGRGVMIAGGSPTPPSWAEEFNQFNIEIVSPFSKTAYLNFSVSSGSVTIDWGDGNTASASGSTFHTYSPSSFPANYSIKMYYSGNGTVSFLSNAFGTDAEEKSMLTEAFMAFGTFGYYALASCAALKTVILPPSLPLITSGLFNYCYSLETIIIPNTVTRIDTVAFAFCSALKSVNIPSSVTVIGDSAFASCTSLESITLPSQIASIPASLFTSCTSLKTVNIPESVTSIGGSAFYGCTALTNINIPENVTLILSSAFYNCQSLKSVNIPKSVVTIAGQAFRNCSNLIIIDLSEFEDTIPTLGNSNAFSGIPYNAKFPVKNQDRLDAFSAATNWSTYASQYVIKDW